MNPREYNYVHTFFWSLKEFLQKKCFEKLEWDRVWETKTKTIVWVRDVENDQIYREKI